MSAESINNEKTIIQELNANVELGFAKSVDELYNDIITYLKQMTSMGLRFCQYNRAWYKYGTIMSPIHIGYDGKNKNSVLLSEAEQQKILNTIRQKLTNDKIVVGSCEAIYRSPNKINYALNFIIDLEIPEPEKDKCNSQIPINIDFKCSSC